VKSILPVTRENWKVGKKVGEKKEKSPYAMHTERCSISEIVQFLGYPEKLVEKILVEKRLLGKS
jgi:hypothetical protein